MGLPGYWIWGNPPTCQPPYRKEGRKEGVYMGILPTGAPIGLAAHLPPAPRWLNGPSPSSSLYSSNFRASHNHTLCPQTLKTLSLQNKETKPSICQCHTQKIRAAPPASPAQPSSGSAPTREPNRNIGRPRTSAVPTRTSAPAVLVSCVVSRRRARDLDRWDGSVGPQHDKTRTRTTR